jgi:hypothetical protein
VFVDRMMKHLLGKFVYFISVKSSNAATKDDSWFFSTKIFDRENPENRFFLLLSKVQFFQF